MPIYTRTGDEGKTSLWDGNRLEKTETLFEVCGAIDEAQCALGLARSCMPSSLSGEVEDLESLMKAVMSRVSKGTRTGVSLDCEKLERKIDDLTALCPPERGFVLPGPSPAGAAVHLARAIVRRAERNAWKLFATGKCENETCVFLNRLSDCLFALAEASEMEAFVEKVVNVVIKGGKKMKSETLDLETAKIAALACEVESRTLGIPMVIVVSDETGRVILLHRMDGSLPVSLGIAEKKAKTASVLRMATHELALLVTPGKPLYGLASDETLCVFGGGVPIRSGGRVIGAIGVSGGTVDEDLSVAMAGISALENR